MPCANLIKEESNDLKVKFVNSDREPGTTQEASEADSDAGPAFKYNRKNRNKINNRVGAAFDSSLKYDKSCSDNSCSDRNIFNVTSTVTLNPSITEYTGDSQRSSTTPKAPPNREYYDFIMKGLKVDMNLEERLDGEDQAMLAQNSIHDQQQHQDDQQQRQSTTIEEDIPVNSAIMAFARKSIMQHASSSPKTIFRKLSSNRPTGSSSNVQSTSNIINSRTKPSSALTKVDENRNMNGIKRSISAMEQSFKFVSRPELAIPAANDPKKIATMTPPSSDATKNNGSDTQSPALSTTAFSRSALDFSQPLAPRVSKMGSCNTVASKIMPVVKDTEPQQHSTIVTPVSQLRTPPSGSDVSLPSEVDTEMLPAYTMAPSNTNGLIAFDLRSALRIVRKQ
ncbi:hypothetical protein BC939DRAFT_481198 [Gamsiella multidivaricata]|uniref:uncharacterized protein n=1 Tax=Gamsiella multidivaricata TaxID=101098 RepID=UPI0022212225|nr:uncharacterized protein BC939DRAFT_481198 [Gamsiella multidivaricata]KAI7817404.1 hypothetical protein BC939DRAFT_481198 [Gamsiella multidivaricata]